MNNVITKKELVDLIAEKTETSKKDTAAIIDATLDAIKNALVEGDTIDLPRFGKFSVVERSERTGINPKTKEKLIIPATKAVKFKVSKTFANDVKEK